MQLPDQPSEQETTPQNSAPTADGLLFDAAVMAGLVGSGTVTELRDEIEREFSARIADENAGFAQTEEALVDAISSAREAEAAAERSLVETRQRKESLKLRIDELLRESASVTKERAASFERLRARRLEYPVRIIAHRLALQVSISADLVERLLAEERRLVGYEEEILAIAQRRRELNATEYARRAGVLEECRAEADRRYREHDELIGLLRKWGITRTVSGFLVWAGYASFPVFGWYFGSVIRDLHEKPAGGAFAGLLGLVVSGLARLVARIGLATTAFAVILAPIAALALAFAVVWAADHFLQHFDKSWKGGSKRDRSRDDSMFAWLNGPTQRARRAHYTQFLAKLPLFYLLTVALLMVAVFLAAGAPLDASQDAAKLAESPWLSVVYTSFGILVGVTLSAFAVLYLSKILEPRYRRLLREATLPAKGWLAAHAELVLIGAAFILAIVGSDLVRAMRGGDTIWHPLSTTAITLLMLLGAFAAAYGIMYRGLFRDQEALLNERQSYERDLQRYVGLPIIEQTDRQLEKFRNELETIHQQVADAWERADYWQRPFTALMPFETDVSEDHTARLLRGWRKQHVRRQSNELLNADELLEPASVSEIMGFEQRLVDIAAELRSVRAELGQLDQQQLALQAQTWGTRVATLRADLAEKRRAHCQRLDTIQQAQRIRRIELENAYVVGASLRSSGMSPGAPTYSRPGR